MSMSMQRCRLMATVQKSFKIWFTFELYRWYVQASSQRFAEATKLVELQIGKEGGRPRSQTAVQLNFAVEAVMVRTARMDRFHLPRRSNCRLRIHSERPG